MKIDCVKRIEKANEIIIYGAGKIASQTIEYINTIGKKILGVVVTEKTNNENYFYGHEVKTIQQFNDNKDSLVCIALSKRYYADIKEHLLSMGFKNMVLVEYEIIDS